MIRRLFLLMIPLGVVLSAQSQKSIPEAVLQLPEDQLIDTLWYYTQWVTDQSLPYARHLIAQSEESNSYPAEVNGYQLIGETYYMMGKLDSSSHFYLIALEICTREDDPLEMSNSLVSLASVETEKGNFDVAIEYYERAIEYQNETGNNGHQCDAHLRMGNLLINSDELDRAMAAYLKGIDYCEKAGNRVFMGYGYDAIGTIHKKQQNFEKAVEMYEHSREIYLEEGDTMGLSGYHNNVGIVYKNQGKFEEAYDHYLEGLALMKTQHYKRAEMSFLVNMGIVSNKMNKTDQALEHLREGLGIAQPIGITVSLADIYKEMAVAFLSLNQLDSAMIYADRAVTTSQEGRHLEKLYDAYKTRSEIHEEQGNATEALSDFKFYSQFRDSIFSIEKAAEIDRLQTVHEAEKNEAEILRLEGEQALDKTRKRALMIGLVGVILIALLIINRILLKRKKDKLVHEAQLEVEQLEKDRLGEQLEYKKKELTAKVLHIAQKNEMLSELKADLDRIKKAENKVFEIEAVNRKIKFEEQIDKNWDQFTHSFTETNQDFFKILTKRHPEITKSELRLAALIQMNLTSKEIATILNISDEGVKKSRYRLRKKLRLDSEEGLEKHLLQL
jgi:tetratricopeptide (TPR) repeat protein